MIFTSLQFLVFFVIVFSLYYLLPYRMRWPLLLISSVYFYMAFSFDFILDTGLLIIIDYFFGKWIAKASGKKRQHLLIAGILINVLFLLIFIYYNFISQNIGDLLSLFYSHTPLPHLGVLVPVGLSYFTFQSISYKIEISRNNISPEPNIGIYALYILYFPKIASGPIERPKDLIPQFRVKHDFDFELMKSGLSQMAFGFFKKLVIADRLAMVVDSAYKNPQAKNGTEMLIATIFYSFQIYCDFSGYIDIALGASKTLGIRLTDNFNKPYFSTSVADFWKRWHITLSFWLRDYIYLPLAYSLSRKLKKERYLSVRSDKWIYYAATSVTFLLCGLWHGPAWHYIFWGGLFALYLCFSIATSKPRKKFYKKTGITKYPQIHTFTKTIITFVLITFAWIFFRSDSITQALLVIKQLAGISISDHLQLPINTIELLFSVFLIISLIIKEKYFFVITAKTTLSWAITLSLIILCCYFFGIFNYRQFIYFQF